MSPSKTQNKPLSNPSPRPPVGAPAQEAVGLHPQPDPLADACGNAPRKKTRTVAPGAEADACGNAPRKKTRTVAPGAEADACGNAPRKKTRTVALGAEADACGNAPRKKTRTVAPGAEADACGNAPRKNTRPVGRSGHVRGRRPHRRRSLATVSPSMPPLSLDSPGMEGEIALLRSLTNRLLSKRPIDHVQISRYLRILARSLPANSRMPRELTDEEQIDALIKKVFHKTVDEGEMTFFDLLPVRMAQPGDKWWPWRHLVPLQHRQGFGLIGPQDPRPPGDAEYFANLNACEEAESHYLEDAFDEDPPDDLDIFTDDPGPLPDPDDEYPNDEEYPLPYGEAPPTLTVISEKSEIYPLPDTPPDKVPPRNDLTVIPAEAETHPRKESRLSSKTPQPEDPPQQDAPSHESIPRAAPDPPDLTIIPDSDWVEDALRRESIPRGGAAHPERRRRVERGGGPALPTRHTGPPPPRTARGRPRPP